MGATYISALHRTFGWEAMKSRYSLVRGDRILPATILGLSSHVPWTGADLLRDVGPSPMPGSPRGSGTASAASTAG